MKLTVDLDLEEYSEDTIWNKIESKLCDMMVAKMEKKEGQLTKLINEKFKEMIDQELKVIAEQIINRGLPVYDHCGKQTGCEPWDKIMEKSMQSFLNRKVDGDDGRDYTGSYSNQKMTRIDYLVSEFGQKVSAAGICMIISLAPYIGFVANICTLVLLFMAIGILIIQILLVIRDRLLGIIIRSTSVR